jgi:hypothetical protein
MSFKSVLNESDLSPFSFFVNLDKERRLLVDRTDPAQGSFRGPDAGPTRSGTLTPSVQLHDNS